MSKLGLDAGATSPIDQYIVTPISAVAFGAGAVSVLPAPAREQLQADGIERQLSDWTADFAWHGPKGRTATHGPVGREVMEAIRLSLTATH